MKVAIAMVQVPFLTGGAELHAQALLTELRKRKLEAEIVTVPFKWYPPQTLHDQMVAARLFDLSEVNGVKIDRCIAMKFPAYYVQHPRKSAWILHQHRQAYELFETPLSDLHLTPEGRRVAAEIRKWDNALLPEHRPLCVNSRNVQARLRRFNNLESEVLYPPPANATSFHTGPFEPFILYPGRFDQFKRQHLIVEAMAQLPEPFKLVLIGNASTEYGKTLRKRISALGLEGRVEVRGLVDEAEKIDLYSRCSVVYNGVFDEDYGYVTIEGFLSGKPVLTHTDSGGPLEFVRDGENGWITAPTPEATAAALRDALPQPRVLDRLGSAGLETIRGVALSWDVVIEKLLG